MSTGSTSGPEASGASSWPQKKPISYPAFDGRAMLSAYRDEEIRHDNIVHDGLIGIGPVVGDGGPKIESEGSPAEVVTLAVEQSVRVIPVDVPMEPSASLPSNIQLA